MGAGGGAWRQTSRILGRCSRFGIATIPERDVKRKVLFVRRWPLGVLDFQTKIYVGETGPSNLPNTGTYDCDNSARQIVAAGVGRSQACLQIWNRLISIRELGYPGKYVCAAARGKSETFRPGSPYSSDRWMDRRYRYVHYGMYVTFPTGPATRG